MHQYLQSRGLAAYSVMLANEASGIGGRSYGRIALYLLQVSLFVGSDCNLLYMLALRFQLQFVMYLSCIYNPLILQSTRFQKAPLVNSCILH